jgi:hydrogenase expression/formation protein HypC
MCLGIPGRVVSIEDAERKLATVDVSGVTRLINLACVVDEEHPIESILGAWVLVHVGFAMSCIDEAQARETLQILTELGEAQKELAEIRQTQALLDGESS